MNSEIRSFDDADAPAVAGLMRRLVPQFLVTAEVLLHWLRTAPERAHQRLWVAEEVDGLAGFAWVDFKWWVAEPGVGSIFLVVRPESRRRGHGTALYDVAEAHFREHGAWKLAAHVTDDDGRGFAERRGFSERRRERLSQLDVAAADISELDVLEAAKRAEGLRLAPLGELLDRPRDLHALYGEAAEDIPGDEQHAVPDFDEWRLDTLANPLLDPDGSMNVLDGDLPVAFAWLLVDREGSRGEHELTGTLRAYRGRALARLAKLAAIRWCRENGIRTLLTGNDAENAPMLAINNRLGYAPTVVHVEFAKQLARPGADEI
jgi:GNAT superfamily N-acetyltransferase